MRRMLFFGLLVAVVALLAACHRHRAYAPPPPPPQQPPVVIQTPMQPPVVILPPMQPPVIIQPPVQPVVIQLPVVIQPPVQPPVITPPPEQPPQPPEAPAVWQDVVNFDPAAASVQQVGGRWFVMAGDTTLLGFEGDEAGARQALNIIRFYRLNSQCSIGRPTPLLQYYLVDGRPPAGPMPGEMSLPLDRNRLDVAQVNGRWMLVQGSVWLLDFGPAEAEARAALGLIRGYGFTHICLVGQPQPVMVYFRAGGAGVYLPYVQAQLVTDAPCYSGPLPATIDFRGSITVGQPCVVQYTFVRNDGSVGPVYSMRFEQPGVADVAMHQTLAQEGRGWLALRVLSPIVTQSSPAFFEVQPEARPVVLASVSAEPPVYTGRFPATLRFRGAIRVGQPCEVQYAFVRSDGTVGPTQTLSFPRRGTREVFDEWTLPRDYVGWSAIRIYSPVQVASSPAPFEVRSGGHRHIEVALRAEPRLYSGALPAPIDFRGMIAVGQPCDVQYVFVRSDNVISPIHRLRFERPGAREVSDRWAVASEGAGWEALRVISPVPAESEQATFEVKAAPKIAVEATLRAEPPAYKGPAPATIHFRGVIQASQACDVQYVFLRSDGTSSAPQTLHFDRPGSQPVEESRQFRADAKGWEKIIIQGQGVAAESGRADFDVTIREPLKLEATLQAVPPKYDGVAPATIQFKGTIQASQACDVKYLFAHSDRTSSAAQTVHFDRPGSQPVEESRQFDADTKGWEKIVIQGQGVAAESGKADFDVTIREPVKLEAKLQAVPPKYDGVAPATIQFKGTIQASQACDVKYQFARSDGTSSAAQTLHFDRPGTQPVEESRQFDADTKGWEKIVIHGQKAAVESNKAAFSVNIREPLRIEASLKAEPPKYVGPAPATVQLKGAIKANQPCEVRYAFVRSDNEPTPPKTLKFGRPGTQDVGLDMKYTKDASGWFQLEVLAPVGASRGEACLARTGKADFDVKIQEPPRVEVGLRVDPPKYEGPPPAAIVFKGTIKVDQRSEVKYTFVRSDTGPSTPKSLQFDDAGSKEIEFPMQFTKDFQGWGQLRVLAPAAAESAKVAVVVDIKEPKPEAPKVEVKLKAEPDKYEGKLPVEIRFKGTIRAAQACEVKYLFERSDKQASPVHTLRFAGPGEKAVEETWKVQREVSGWVKIVVLAPVKAESDEADFEVKKADP